MAGSFKRKLDSIVDNMDVIVPDMEDDDYNKFGKKFKVDATHHINLGWPIEWKNCKGSVAGISDNSDFNCDTMDYMEGGSRCPRKPMYPSDIDSDVPSTHEVIDSLRKVKLWLSAQEENNEYHLQHISSVEDYAMSKHHNFNQQRKITDYLIRNH